MKKGGQKTPKKPVLIIQHAPHEHPAVIRRALETQGITSICIYPFRGDAYPKPNEISGLISMGGPMGANDEAEHPWIKSELLLLKKAVESELPVVGVCLGGQLLARALGGKVEKNHTWEIGWFPVELNPHGQRDPVIGAAGDNPMVYHWHADTFHLPQGAILLGQSQGCERQAFKIGDRAYGFQFHPEADHQLVMEWLSSSGIDEEISEVRKKHGPKTIQDAATQRNHATKGERASLKITAAIGGLFRDQKYDPIDCEFHDNLESWSTLNSLLVIEFVGSDGKPIRLRGKIVTTLTIPAGEFLIFQEENTLLWPIRMDDLKTIALSSSH